MPNPHPNAVFARGSIEKLGLLTAQHNKNLTVFWEDGTEESVTSGDFSQAPFGSAQFLVQALPDLVAEYWSDPEAAAALLALHLSATRPGLASGALLGAARTHLLLPEALTTAEWRKVRATFLALPDVTTKASKLVWSADSPPDLVPPALSERWARLLELSSTPHPDASAQLPPTPGNNLEARDATSGTRHSPAPTPSERTSTGAELGQAFITELIDHGRVERSAAQALANDPAGQLRITLTNQQRTRVRKAVSALTTESRPLACEALVLVAGALTTDQLTQWASASGAAAQLEALAGRLRSSETALISAARGQIAHLVSTIVETRPTEQDSMWLPQTLAILSAGQGTSARSAAAALTSAMARTLAQTRRLNGDDGILHSALATLPLSRGGARIHFLAALSRLEPSSAAGWLDSAGIDDLLTLSDSELLSLTAVPSWARHIELLAHQALEVASTRSRVFSLLASTAVATALRPDEVSSALERVSARDAPLRS